MRAPSPGSRGKALASVVLALLGLGVVGIYLATHYPQETTGTPVSPSVSSLGNSAGKIVVGTVGQVGPTIDPAGAGDSFATNIIRNLGAGLVDLAPGTSKVVPALAENWTSANQGATWIFTLRKGISFPDGSAFNATVEAISVNRSIDIHSGSFSTHGYDHLIMDVRVLSSYVIEFDLSHPTGVEFVADTSLFPVDPRLAVADTILNYTGDTATENPNGLGPYTLANWTRSHNVDHSLSMTSNTSYWNKSAPQAMRLNVTLLFMPDKASLLHLLSSGGIDIAYIDPSYGGLQNSDTAQFSNSPSFKIWSSPQVIGAFSIVSRANIGGVVLDSTGIFRYYLLTKS